MSDDKKVIPVKPLEQPPKPKKVTNSMTKAILKKIQSKPAEPVKDNTNNSK